MVNINIHEPVMLEEVKKFIPVAKKINIIDATFGGGGYSKALLEVYNVNQLIAIDRDPITQVIAKDLSKRYKNFKIIARSDARNVEGLEKMIDRCKSYIDTGAEIIFPEALKDEKEFEIVRKKLKCYLLANMTEFGKSKLLDYKKLENLGYNIVIYPVTTQRLAMKNVEDGLRAIFEDGHQNNIIDKMQTRKRLYDLVEYEKYNALDEKIYNFSTEGHE